MGDSIVEYFGSGSGHHCGYCKSPSTSVSHGMWAHSLTVDHYQALIDRGWRRSGKYCYKPIMSETCCPQYPIRCDVHKFVLHKSQKKAIKKVNRYLNTGQKPGDTQAAKTHATESAQASRENTKSTNCVNPTAETSKVVVKGKGADPTKPKCVKAKLLRKQRCLEKQAATGAGKATGVEHQKPKKPPTPKTVQDFLNECVENSAHKLKLRLVVSSPPSEIFQSTFDEAFNVYKKYQMSIHKDPESKLTIDQYKKFLVNSPLQIRLVCSSPPCKEFGESLTESYEVFKKYQMSIHKEDESDCSKSGFNDFLCESPLMRVAGSTADSPGMGSFHQQYLLDGRIVAVGVIDILPKCTSSVYLYYDPEFEFLGLGTYSALQEVEFTRSLRAHIPTLEYYYMGYYIHSCPKMKYKGHYEPSYLACPESYEWCPYIPSAAKLDVKEYSRLAPPGKQDKGGINKVNYDVTVLYCRQAMPYGVYLNITKATDKEKVAEYGRLVGRDVARTMLLYRSKIE